MEIVGKSVCLNFVEQFQLNEQLSFKAEILAMVGIDGKGEKYCDVNIVDYSDVVFMGMKVEEDYNSFQKFKQNFQNLGIDIVKQMDKVITKFIQENITVEKYPHIYEFLEQIG